MRVELERTLVRFGDRRAPREFELPMDRGAQCSAPPWPANASTSASSRS